MNEYSRLSRQAIKQLLKHIFPLPYYNTLMNYLLQCHLGNPSYPSVFSICDWWIVLLGSFQSLAIFRNEKFVSFVGIRLCRYFWIYWFFSHFIKFCCFLLHCLHHFLPFSSFLSCCLRFHRYLFQQFFSWLRKIFHPFLGAFYNKE